MGLKASQEERNQSNPKNLEIEKDKCKFESPNSSNTILKLTKRPHKTAIEQQPKSAKTVIAKSNPKSLRLPFSRNTRNTALFSSLEFYLMQLFVHSQPDVFYPVLDEHEKSILESILRKKKFYVDKEKLEDQEYMKKLQKYSPSKKREAKLKYVIPKCFKHLRARFKSQLLEYQNATLKSKSKRIDREYTFFMYFFESVVKSEGIPIEKFFSFRNWTHRFSEHIPKTITTESIDLWKKSPVFISNLMKYLNREFMDDIAKINVTKVNSFLHRWRILAEDRGVPAAVESIRESMKLKGTKVPWTISEAHSALEVTLELLN